MANNNPANQISKGLSEIEVTESRNAHGRNVLTPPRRPSAFKLYLGKFNDPIIRILLLAACLSLVVSIIQNEYAETIGIFCAVFLATGISFYFENDAARRFDELNAIGSETTVKVVRGGNVTEISRSDVVVGDIVILGQGDEVPADGVLLEAVSLQIDESSLTGEPPVSKSVEPGNESSSTYAKNVALRSTMVVEGRGVMKVTAVGDATEIGKVQRQAMTFVIADTPLNRQLKRLSRFISRIAFGVAILAFFVLTVHELIELNYGAKVDWLEVFKLLINNFMMAVTLIVMAVPEGLPMAVSLSLALNMRRMLKTNNLVRKMHASETMGAITVICTDKTGTLTQNRMQVSEIVYEGDKNLLCESIAANSTAHLEKENHYRGVGNPTECALLLWMHGEGVDYSVLRAEAGVVNQLTFSTERKYMATLVESRVLGRRALFVKGAPEIVAGLCNISQEQKDELSARLKKYQSQAMRTLAFAYKEVPAGNDDAEALAKAGGLTYMGVAAINDPVRDEVPAAIESCKRAGIQVKVVTGDTAGTAIEIARRIGLWTAEDTAENTISGPEFAALSDEEASERAARLKVMSRARPLDKQRLVQLLQKRGEVVAVTGDGTNDAPALNFADVGLSMGSGTSVAKEASDITLLDDSFASIETAVMWGRSLYKNIQRFVMFQLTINFVALAVVLVGAVIGTTLPLTVTQMLWVNLIMDTFAAMALASLPPSRRVMNEKPRKTSDFIITPRMAKHLLFTSLAFVAILLTMLVMIEKDGDISIKSLSMFFTTFVMLQFWNLLNMKAFDSSNHAFHKLLQCRGLLIVLAIIFAGQVIIVEFGGKVFRTCHLNFSVWLQIFLATSLIFLIPEIVKAISRQIKRSMSRK